MVTPMDKDKEADTRLNVEKTFLEKSIASDALSVDIAMPRVRSLSKFKIDETKNNGEGNSCCIQFIRQNKIVLWIERVVLIWICIAVAGGFSVPIIIYACDTDRGNNTKSLSDFNLNSCPGTTLVQVCTDIHIHVASCIIYGLLAYLCHMTTMLKILHVTQVMTLYCDSEFS